MNRPSFARNAQEIHNVVVHRFDAAAAIDARECSLTQASLLIEFRPKTMPRILALGTTAEVDAHPAAAEALRHDLVDFLLIPGLVNTHTHLDLTHIGPRPHDPSDGFLPWVDLVRRERRSEPEAIAESVREGIALSVRGGSVAVGDIAGSVAGAMTLVPWRELSQSGLLGVSYLEFFGIGKGFPRSKAAIEKLLASEEWGGVRAQGRESGAVAGMQPHAPYSVDRRLYQWVAERAKQEGIPLTTHLAETPDERRFVRDGDGPNLEFLKSLGLWDGSIAEEIGRGATAIGHLAGVLRSCPMLAAHVHDASDRDLDLLAEARASVAYCPRAGVYFGADRYFGPHRYRDMLARGINVCLGTDSVINLPAKEVARSGISILDEMRLLYRRDHADPKTLLAMGTTNGAQALQFEPEWFRLQAGGSLAGLVAIEIAGIAKDRPKMAFDAWNDALSSSVVPRLLFHANLCCTTVLFDGIGTSLS